MKTQNENKKLDIKDVVIRDTALEEQETTINIYRDDEFASIYTSDNTILTKMKKLVMANPDEWMVQEIIADKEGNVSGVKIKVPKDLISFRSAKVTRQMTEEQKAAAAERMKNLRSKKENTK